MASLATDWLEEIMEGDGVRMDLLAWGLGVCCWSHQLQWKALEEAQEVSPGTRSTHQALISSFFDKVTK